MKRISARWWNGCSTRVHLYRDRHLPCGVGLILSVLLLTTHPADARLLQILHTNDLHSYMESSEIPGRGGYAAVKATIEEARREARDQGIETIVLDAGDFSEGTPYFFADNGKQSWRMIDAMGYDAVTIGNHDWLVGPEQMDLIAREIAPRTPFLAANIAFSSQQAAIKKAVRPFVELERSGLRIAVLGITTDEIFYSWRMNEGSGIGNPIATANKFTSALKSRNDLLILLTHLGAATDLKLASRTQNVDLIVGGHSHSNLHAPLYINDLNKRPVPIVQAGSHGEWVGKILVDVEPRRPMKIIDYRLLPVDSQKASAPEAAEIRDMIAETRRQLQDRYGASRLEEPIGFSNIPIERPKDSKTVWGSFFMTTLRDAASADFAVDPGEFHGSSQPAGVITPETLMNAYPRVFEMNRLTGWNVWKIQIPGWMIQILVDQVVQQGLHLNTAGLTFDVSSNFDGVRATNLKVNGRRVNWFKRYTMAVSEGIGRGSMEISFLLQLLFNPQDTGIPIWGALEDRLKASGGSFSGISGSSPLGMIQ